MEVLRYILKNDALETYPADSATFNRDKFIKHIWIYSVKVGKKI